MSGIYNKHSLYVETGNLTDEQVIKSFRDFISALDIKEVKDDGFEVNVVRNSAGESYYFAQVWINSIRAYNAIIGLNYNGTRRVETIDADSTSTVWGDSDTTEVALPPLSTFPSFDGKTVKVSRSYIPPPSDNIKPNVLCCRNAPTWITVSMIRPLFTKFNSDPREEKGQSYPHVYIKPNSYKKDAEGKTTNLIFVTFSPRSQYISDAGFCLQMRRRTRLSVEDREAVLSFSHWTRGRPTN